MATKSSGKKFLFLVFLLILAIVLLLLGFRYFWEKSLEDDSLPFVNEIPGHLLEEESERLLEPGVPIEGALAREMAERKEDYGVKDGVDMIVSSDESIRIGDEVLKMRDFETQDALSKGEVVSETLDGRKESKVQMYGIYLVKPGDNLWNIHYRVLRENLSSRGVKLPRGADQPRSDGRSSGVAKVLKFSEGIVRIYNMKTKAFSEDINMIQPHEKIIIYNMERLKHLLDDLTAANLNKIRFDGNNLWIPAP